jgi:carbonic anhydrase/acetyltransferase-like protein (isoleucine patch superfamily)
VQLGAVVAIGSRRLGSAGDDANSTDPAGDHSQTLLAEPLACIDVTGRSLVERMIEQFVAIDVEIVSVVVEAGTSLPTSLLRTVRKNVSVEVVSDLHSAISRKLADYSQQGIDHSFLNEAGDYTETDLLDLFCFHRESRQTATPTFDKEGQLSLGVVDCAKAQSAQLENLPMDAESNGASKYFIREYVSRLRHPKDLRQLAADILRGRCQTGPSGQQVRSGVWIDEGAEIHRRARVVGPAYIGRESKVKADALVTRCSNIEKDCCVDVGTVIEDSSILPNTSIGIWLDLCHAVASANKLINLERNVVIEISDPSVMRSNAAAPLRIATVSQPSEEFKEERKKTADCDLRATRQMPDAWQFGENLIQE